MNNLGFKKNGDEEEKRERGEFRKLEIVVNNFSTCFMFTNYISIYRQSKLKPKTYQIYFYFNTKTIYGIRLCRIHLTPTRLPTSTRSNTPQSNTTLYKTMNYNF